MALQLSSLLHDDMLVEEGALRAYHMLAPLLDLKSRSPMLHKALASVHMALQVRCRVGCGGAGPNRGGRVYIGIPAAAAAAAVTLVRAGILQPTILAAVVAVISAVTAAAAAIRIRSATYPDVQHRDRRAAPGVDGIPAQCVKEAWKGDDKEDPMCVTKGIF